MRFRLAMAVVAALGAPFAGSGADPYVLLGGEGNQTAPSMEGAYLAFLGDRPDTPGGYDVFVKDLSSGLITPLTVGGSAVGLPQLSANRVAYFTKSTIEVYDAAAGSGFLRIEGVQGLGRLAVTPELVAWDENGIGGGDVAWRRFGTLVDRHLPLDGMQGAVAAAFGNVAYVDGRLAGTVHVVDTASETDRVVYDGARGGGTPIDVAIWSPDSTVPPVVAVTLSVAGGTEIAVVDLSGAELARLAIPGLKRNVHLLGDWVGFEDLSLGVAQVFIWDWSVSAGGVAPVLETAGPPAADQVLHQIVEAGVGVKVVWASLNPTQYDIFEWDWAPTQEDPGTEPPVPVQCSDARATVLADFVVAPTGATAPDGDADDVADGDADRDRDSDRDDAADDEEVRSHDGEHGNDGWHVRETVAHDESWHSLRRWRAAGGAAFDAASNPHVLVCVTATDVITGWVAVGHRVVASPEDFTPGTVALEARLAIPVDGGEAGAVVLGKAGANVRVRVLADPGGDDAGSTCRARGDCPRSPGGILHKLGCASGGGAASLGSLLLLGLVALRPGRRRARR